MIQPAVKITPFPGLSSRPQAWAQDAVAVLLLGLLALWVFRGHFFGDYLFLGNPDRLNSDLKILRHYLFNPAGGRISAWNDHEMMGYDSFVLPYTFPNPLASLIGAFGESDMYVAAGYAVIAMLAAAGIAAYAFLRTALPAGLPALAGAICYQFSMLALLKAGQNSMSFAVFIVIPLAMTAVRLTRRETAVACLAALAVLLAGMLNFMFLQKAAYALMLVGAYAAWRSRMLHSWYPLAVLGAAFVAALVFAAPRIAGIALAIQEYARTVDGVDLKDFDTLYRFQNVLPYQIVRWFDFALLGRSPSEDQVLGNNVNLTEGFLLATAAIAPFVLLTGLRRDWRGWLTTLRTPQSEAFFYFWILVACVLVIVSKPVAHAVFLLFMRMDFTHARILIAALLPQSMLLALALAGLAPQIPGRVSARTLAMGLAAGLVAALGVDLFSGLLAEARSIGVKIPDKDGPWSVFLERDAVFRIVLSAALYFGLLRTLRKAAARPQLQHAAHAAICALLAAQCVLAANQQINGPHAFNATHPFLRGDFYYAKRAEFNPPTEAQIRVLHERIEPEKYRIALVCDWNIAGGFCAGHVPEFWRLRAIDGYYGLGVPGRLRALPWPNGASLRTVSFLRMSEIPWDFLGFLNVRHVLVSGDGVYRNIAGTGNAITGKADPSGFKVVTSPARVTPRAFFTGSVQPVASARHAAVHMFQEAISDSQVQSYAEGWPASRRFDLSDSSSIAVKGSGDVLDVEFDPAPTERFLVLNDLYFPGWHAQIGDAEATIFPTNAVMRGVVVPASARQVRFRYQTRSDALRAEVFQAGALLLLLVAMFVMRRKAKA